MKRKLSDSSSSKRIKVEKVPDLETEDQDNSINVDLQEEENIVKSESQKDEVNILPTRSTKFQIVDPSKIPYKPIKLTADDDVKLQRDIINDPIRGYFYYMSLGDQLGTILYYFTRKSGLQLIPHRASYLSFKSWDLFIQEYRFVAYDKETWRLIGSKLNIAEVASNSLKYRKVLVDLLNCIYLGYTKGLELMNWELADRLVFFANKCTKNNYIKYLNLQYYKLLCKEFTEFHEFQTGYGNSMKVRIKCGNTYVCGDDLNVDDTLHAVEWTDIEKNIFYEALARYSISRVDEISNLLPNKSTVDIMNFYTALSKELARYKADKNLRKKLLQFDSIPIAYEMSDMYVETEENFANAIEKLDESQFGSQQGEYRGKYYREMTAKTKDLFNTKQMEKLLSIVNELNFELTENKTKALVEVALFDMYYIIRDYIHELIFRLFKKKMNELNIEQHLEWTNLLKSLSKPPDPKKMVCILNLKNMNEKVNEKLNYFDQTEGDYANDSEFDSNDENDFYPDLTKREKGFMNNTNPKGILIMDNFDIFKLGITKEEVYSVTENMFREFNCSNGLWMKLKGKLDPLVGTVEETSDTDKTDLPSNDFNDAQEFDLSDVDHADSDYTNENFDSYDESDNDFNPEFMEYSSILNNAQDIEDLESDDDYEDFIEDDAEEWDDIKYDWYDDEFIVPDTGSEFCDNRNSKNFVSGIDLTTKGHEYLQILCDNEEQRLEEKDIQESIKYENVLLTQLNLNGSEDELNDRTYADVFSQVYYGEVANRESSWKPGLGGPAPMFDNPQVKKNIIDFLKKIEAKQRSADVTEKDVEKFKHTYNDY